MQSPVIRLYSVRDNTPAGLYLASLKWHERGRAVNKVVEWYMQLHPDADQPLVLAEIEAVRACLRALAEEDFTADPGRFR